MLLRIDMQQDIEKLTQSELFHRVGSICALVNRVIDVQDLLNVSLKETMDLFEASRGSLFIMDDRTSQLVLRAAFGLKWAEKNQIVKKMGEGVVGRVAQMKTPIVVEDIAVDERFQDFQPRSSYATSSFICAPLLVKDKLMGVINIADKRSGHAFGNHELQLLDFLATQIALNYKRVDLYRKLRSVLQRSRDLRDELGKSSQEKSFLKRQIIVHEKLATLGKLAGGIAHEFNNPLDGVIRYTNLCLQQAGDDGVMRGYLLEIKQGLNRMANIVRSLLACSRGTAARDKVQRSDPNTAVLQALEALKIDLSQKYIVVEKRLSAGLPMIADWGLERIVENLLRNALDAVEESTGKIVVETSLDADQLILTVEDNGCGIQDAEDVERIFEPFYTTKGSEKGCGLGLTIVSEIVKSYEGHIDLETEPGQGTKFIITLPIEGS